MSLEAVAEDSAIFVASSARSLPKSSPLPAVSVSRCAATPSASEPSAVAFEMRATTNSSSAAAGSGLPAH
jgi:hypothetical protein